jgi:SAM-dependent methyltransferase
MRMICEGHLGGFIEGGDPMTWCPAVWDALLAEGARSVIDVGCGAGYASEWFHERGCDVLGVDGSETAERLFRVPGRFLRHDYTAAPLYAAFALAWSCEFVEHVEEKYAANYLATFAGCRTVAMTYAEPGQPGHHHVNCQPAAYWVARFAEYGLRFDEPETMRLRGLESGTHFAARGMVFRRC